MPRVLDAGHADVTVDLDTDEIVVPFHDREGTSASAPQRLAIPASTVLSVPSRAAGGPGRSRLPVPRASPVIPCTSCRRPCWGGHVHGEIDPHLWHDVDNAVAYVEDHPRHAHRCRPGRGAEATGPTPCLHRRRSRRSTARSTGSCPAIPRPVTLITTHDAFRYLALGSTSTSPGSSPPTPPPSRRWPDRRRLAEMIRNLDVPAVFVEPNLIARSSMLTEVAWTPRAFEVCPFLRRHLDARRPHLRRAHARQRFRSLPEVPRSMTPPPPHVAETVASNHRVHRPSRGSLGRPWSCRDPVPVRSGAQQDDDPSLVPDASPRDQQVVSGAAVAGLQATSTSVPLSSTAVWRLLVHDYGHPTRRCGGPPTTSCSGWVTRWSYTGPRRSRPTPSSVRRPENPVWGRAADREPRCRVAWVEHPGPGGDGAHRPGRPAPAARRRRPGQGVGVPAVR